MISWVRNTVKGDKAIWLIIFLMAMIGLLVVYSASSFLAFKYFDGNTEKKLIDHFFYLGISFGAMFVIHLIDYRFFAKISNFLLIVSIPLLLIVLFQGEEQRVAGAGRWIRLFGYSFQPSDFAKFSLIVFLAKMLTIKQEVIKDFKKGFLPLLGWVMVICVLIASEDLSTAALIFSSCLVLMYIGGVRKLYLLLIVLAGALAFLILLNTADRAITWKSRWEKHMTELFHPEDGVDHQRKQANIAIANGGLIGKGPGRSTQKYILPQAASDFVFATLLEEYGFLGGLFILALYLALLYRSVGIVTVSKTFGALLAAGLSLMLSLQAMINMGVAVGLFPVTGQTLPMISMGGTSLLFTGVSLGIILGVSRKAKKEQELGVENA